MNRAAGRSAWLPLVVIVAACSASRSAAVPLVPVTGTQAPPATQAATVPPTTTIPAVPQPIPPLGDARAQFGSRETMRTTSNENGQVRTEVGCLPDMATATLDEAFSSAIGPLIGWDNPHVYPLGADRWLWIVHDSYLDYPGTASTLHESGPQIQNMAILQEGTCFTLVHRGRPDARANFELGDGTVHLQRFFWPLGGELHDGRLMVFWAETVRSVPEAGPYAGIIRHPVATWIAEYDPVTLERLSFRPAPDPGVFPSYGFAVASDDEHTYLFGNSNLLNLDREGGHANGPHSATRMYLARVPLGRLDLEPEYRTADDWSAEPSRAVPVSARFWTENTMQPRYIAGRWVSVVKVDGFWGDDIVVDVADYPWGPWTTVERRRYEPRYGADVMTSYQPILMPWLDENGDLQVVISLNAKVWAEAVASPILYRPAVFSVDWPATSGTDDRTARRGSQRVGEVGEDPRAELDVAEDLDAAADRGG